MIKINPKNKSVFYSIDSLAMVEAAIEDIEHLALEGSCSGDDARGIIQNLSVICDSLGLKQVVRRHKKFAPELQPK